MFPLSPTGPPRVDGIVGVGFCAARQLPRAVPLRPRPAEMLKPWDPENVCILPALRELILDSNRLTAIPDPFFNSPGGSIEGLKFLSVSHNQLDSISPLIGRLIGLSQINLNSNRLPTLPIEIGSLPNLMENRGQVGFFGLDIVYNRICNPNPDVERLLNRNARLDWRKTQRCQDGNP